MLFLNLIFIKECITVSTKILSSKERVPLSGLVPILKWEFPLKYQTTLKEQSAIFFHSGCGPAPWGINL